MGFESYTVLLAPRLASPLAAGCHADTVQRLAGEIRVEWTDIHWDEEEMHCRPYPPRPDEAFLVYETALGLFQIMLSLHQKQVRASARFAYCNPRSVYQPFTSVVASLMARYKMSGSTMASDQSQDLDDGQDVLTVLTPSMDYNRSLWQADAATNEEAILRPGEALERFISSRRLSAASV